MYKNILYYPWIDLQNTTWIKTSLLYWDEIKTIVPKDMNNPYTSEISLLLEKEKILIPYKISSSNIEVTEASQIALRYIHSDEGRRYFNSSNLQSSIHPSKISNELKNRLGLNGQRIHVDKLSTDLKNMFNSLNYDDDGFVYMNDNFVNFYMSALANRIAKRNNFSTVADSTIYNDFNTKLLKDGYKSAHYAQDLNKLFIKCPKCNKPFNNEEKQEIQYSGVCPHCNNDLYYFIDNSNNSYQRYIQEPEQISETMLSKIIIERIHIPSNTPIEKLLKFRQENYDDLRIFRDKIQELANSITNDIEDIRQLREKVNIIHKDKIKPQLKLLKQQLRSSKIKCVASDFTISGMASILGATTLPLGAIPITATAGLAIAVTLFKCYQERKEITLSNPYSYLLSIEKKFT